MSRGGQYGCRNPYHPDSMERVPSSGVTMSVCLRAAMLAVIVSCLSGCAGGPKPLDTTVQAKVTASQAVIGVQQVEVGVSGQPAIVPVFAGATFFSGFVAGAMTALASTVIENTELKHAEKAVGPLRNQMVDFDFDGPALQAMQAGLGKVAWLHLDKVTLTKDVSTDGYDKILDGAQVPYTLFVNESYFLTDDLKRLYVVAQIALLPRPTPGSTIRQGPNGTTYFMPPSDVSNAVYTNVVYYLTAIPPYAYAQFKGQAEAIPVPPHGYVDTDRVAAVLYWGQDGAAPIRRALTDAAAELGQLVMQCLQDPRKPPSFTDEVAVGNSQGRVVGQQGDRRTVIQFSDGSLMSVDTQLVKILRTGKQ